MHLSILCVFPYWAVLKYMLELYCGATAERAQTVEHGNKISIYLFFLKSMQCVKIWIVFLLLITSIVTTVDPSVIEFL